MLCFFRQAAWLNLVILLETFGELPKRLQAGVCQELKGIGQLCSQLHHAASRCISAASPKVISSSL